MQHSDSELDREKNVLDSLDSKPYVVNASRTRCGLLSICMTMFLGETMNQQHNTANWMRVQKDRSQRVDNNTDESCRLCGDALVDENRSSSFIHLDMAGEHAICCNCADEHSAERRLRE